MNSPTSTKQRLTLGDLISFMVVCATRVSKMLKPKPKPKPKDQFHSPKSTRLRLKQLLMMISNKAIEFVHRRRNGRDAEVEEGGVWQRTILMGDKCQPLDFSGVIYYDSKGNLVKELLFRSPRAIPMPSYLSSKQITL